jgi:membrane-bound inhibitor of C-type lysozyme
MSRRPAAILLPALLAAAPALADGLAVSWQGHPFTGTTARYRCDAAAVAAGLPAEPRVQYLNGANNSLAVLLRPDGPLVMAQTLSADGVRYAGGDLVWWSKGRQALVERRGQTGTCTERSGS